jgi:hypothetical protein
MLNSILRSCRLRPAIFTLLAVTMSWNVETACADEAVVNVVSFGAKGDGAADDTAAVQKAIDSVGPTGGTVLFPPGTYQITSVGLKAGVRYLGYGATIKRPAKQGKWVRTFDAWKEGYRHSSDQDSAVIHIEGLDFDGNRAEQGKYEQHELEQAHLIALTADSAKAGRLRVRISNCTFRDCVADAISVYTNVEAQISNCTAIDCFRGGMVLTGGYSRVQMSNFIARGKTHPTGIDVEVDGGGFGGSYTVELLMDNVSLPDGDFDVGVSGESVVIGNRIVANAPFNLSGGGTARLVFSDSEFVLGGFSRGDRIVMPGDMTFRNCRFTARGEGDTAAKDKPTEPPQFAAARIYWNISGSSARDQRVRFQDCVFRGDKLPSDAKSYGIFTYADVLAQGNRLEVSGGEIGPEFAHGVHLSQGGQAVVRNTRIAARQALFLGASEGYFLNVLLDGIEVAGESYAHINTFNAENRITHRNVLLDARRNSLTTDYGLAGNTFLDGRLIHGDAPPTEQTHGLLGDVFRVRSSKPGESGDWQCLKTGSGSGAEWKRQ